MTNNIEIAAKLFKSIANNAKTFDKGIRNNPLSMKAVFVAYAESAAIAAKADKGKNEIMRIEMTKRGLPMFWTKQGDKHNQTPALKMELSAIKICTDNAMHELSDDDFCSMIANADFEIASIRCFKTNMFATPADAKPKASKPKAAPAPADNSQADADVIETKTDTRTKEELFQNFLQVWKAAGHGDFWKWTETVSDEKMAAMTKAATTKKAA